MSASDDNNNIVPFNNIITIVAIVIVIIMKHYGVQGNIHTNVFTYTIRTCAFI